MTDHLHTLSHVIPMPYVSWPSAYPCYCLYHFGRDVTLHPWHLIVHCFVADLRPAGTPIFCRMLVVAMFLFSLVTQMALIEAETFKMSSVINNLSLFGTVPPESFT